MKVMVVYRSVGEHARTVENFLHDFKARTSKDLLLVDPDSREGSDICQLYDIVEYPSILALSNDGELRQMWRGLPLPLVGEVSYYAQ